jgi:hypothetical protein
MHLLNATPYYLTNNEIKNYFSFFNKKIPALYEPIEINEYILFLSGTDNKYLLNLDLSNGFLDEMKLILNFTINETEENKEEYSIYFCPSINALFIENNNDEIDSFVVPLL